MTEDEQGFQIVSYSITAMIWSKVKHNRERKLKLFQPVVFTEQSRLKRYLNEKLPNKNILRQRVFTPFGILEWLNEIIAREKLYDPRNIFIIVCNTALDKALNTNAFHVTEILEKIASQLCEANYAITGPNRHIAWATTRRGKTKAFTRNDTRNDQLNEKISLNQKYLLPRRPILEPNKRNYPISKRQRITARPNLSSRAIPNTPANASGSYKIFTSCLATGLADVDISNQTNPGEKDLFTLKPKLLQILRTLQEVDKTRTTFTYHDVTYYLLTYLLDNENRLYENRNLDVACIGLDPLGEVFRVDYFHKIQIFRLIKAQLIPFPKIRLR